MLSLIAIGLPASVAFSASVVEWAASRKRGVGGRHVNESMLRRRREMRMAGSLWELEG